MIFLVLKKVYRIYFLGIRTIGPKRPLGSNPYIKVFTELSPSLHHGPEFQEPLDSLE